MSAGNEEFAKLDESKQERILRQVRQMLAIADHPNTSPEEADHARTRAETLMFRYRIEEATGVANGSSLVTPVWRDIVLNAADSEFARWYHDLTSVIISHCGVRGVTGWHEDETTGKIHTRLQAVGYSSDLNYMDMILTACMVEFGKRLEPRYDPKLSQAENAYHMRSAGMERKRISRVLFGEWDSENQMKSWNRKVTKMVREECVRRGEDPDALFGRGNSMESYRLSYADGFVSEFRMRLYRLRQIHAQEEGGTLVLVSRKENVDRAFYVKFPQYDPANRKPSEPWKDPREDCAKCQKAKSGYCREHSYLRPRVSRSTGPSYNSTASDRGRTAAQMVDIGNTNTGHRTTEASSRKAIGG